MIPYIKYYRRIKSIPTLNLNDIRLKDLYRQRFNFYFKLGITENDFKNKSVLEFGPGTGYNAHYLIEQCKVKKISLVDHNPASVKALKKHLKKFKNAIILNEDANEFKTNQKFDFTIIENALSGFKNPKKIFNKLLKYTASKGTLVCTFADPIGVFSDKIRYLYAIMLLEQNKIKDFKKRHLFLTNVFTRDLNYLSKNTRPASKWVLDNLMNEPWMKKKIDFNFLHIINILELKKCMVKGVSPNFYYDYIWYKKMNPSDFNKNIIKQYKTNNINFLDFETRFHVKIKEVNITLKKFNKILQSFQYNKKITNKKLREIQIVIKKLELALNRINPNNKVSLSLKEFSEKIDEFLNNKKITKKTKYIYKFWGIGTQALSLYKI